MQVLLWRASEINLLNQTLLIDTNLIRDETNEWYFEAVVEVTKLKKEFNIAPPGNVV